MNGSNNNIFTNVSFVDNHANGQGGAIFLTEEGPRTDKNTLTLEATNGNSCIWSGNTVGSNVANSIHFDNTALMEVTVNVTPDSMLDIQDPMSGKATGGNRDFTLNGGGVWRLNGSDFVGAPLTKATFDIQNGTFAVTKSLDLLRQADNQVRVSENAALEVDLDIDDSFDVALMKDSAGNASSAGSFIKSGSGTLTLTGTDAYGGATHVKEGTLRATSMDALLNTVSASVAAGAKLNFDLAADAAFDKTISGAGELVKDGAGTLTLSGANSRTGATKVTGGKLKAVTTDALSDSSSVELAAGTTLEFALNNQDGMFKSPISGAGDLIKTGGRTLVLDGEQTYTGKTFVGEGTLEVWGKLNNTPLEIKNGATLRLADSGSVTYTNQPASNVIFENGSTLDVRLSAVNATTGRIHMAGGSLELGGAPGHETTINAALSDDVFGLVSFGQTALLRIVDGADSVTVEGVDATPENLAPLLGNISLDSSNAGFFFKLVGAQTVEASARSAGNRLLGLLIARQGTSGGNPGGNTGDNSGSVVDDFLDGYTGGNPLIQAILNSPKVDDATVTRALESAVRMGFNASPMAIMSTMGNVATVNMTRGMSPRQSIAGLTSVFQPFRDTSPVSMDGALLAATQASMQNGSFGRGVSVWSSPIRIYENSHDLSMPGSAFKTGSNASLTGAMVGADLNFDTLRVGMSASTGKGTARSRGDYDPIHADLEYKGVTLYFGKMWDQFGLGGTLNYARTTSKARLDTLGGRLESKVRAEVFSAMLRAEYALELGNWGTLTPHAGVEYLRYQQPTSTAFMNGQGVATTGAGHMQQWRVPVGFSWTRQFQTKAGVRVIPEVHAEYLPSFGDMRMKQRVSLMGSSRPALLTGPSSDRHAAKAGLALEVGGDNLSLILGYDVLLSRHRTTHGVTGSLRWSF